MKKGFGSQSMFKRTPAAKSDLIEAIKVAKSKIRTIDKNSLMASIVKAFNRA